MALLAALTAYVTIDGFVELDVTEPSVHDRNLFMKFLEALPSGGPVVRFLKDQDLGASFDPRLSIALGDFADDWDDAEHQFVDPQLDAYRCELVRSSDELSSRIAEYTVPNRAGLISLGITDFDDRPELWTRRDHLNQLRARAYQAHQALTSAGLRRVPPTYDRVRSQE